MHYGLYKKLTISFAVVENRDVLPATLLPHSKYVGARRIDSSNVKYHKNGFTLMRTKEFVNKYHGDIGADIPMDTDYVLLLSLNRAVAPNRRSIFKTRNKTAAVFPIEIRSVKDGVRVYTDVGLSIDPATIDYSMLTLNIYNGYGEITANTEDTRDYKEKAEDIIPVLSEQIEPVFDMMGSIVRRAPVNIWESATCRTAMMGFINRCLNKADIYSAKAEQFRIELAQHLMTTVSTSHGKVVSGEVTWDSEEDRLAALHEANGDVERAKTMRAGQIRLKWLLDERSFEQRLCELTREEMDNTLDLTQPGIFTAMTDLELNEWYSTLDSTRAAEIEAVAFKRWEKANEK